MALVTVTVTLPDTTPVGSVAVRVAVPLPTTVASPPLVIEMTVSGSLDTQPTTREDAVLPSVLIPVAVNCMGGALMGIGGRLDGVIATLDRTGVPTYNVTWLETTDPSVA
jgi:hypothetical protein